MPSDDEITKGDCHACPWYEDCPRMRGLSVCYSDRECGGNVPQRTRIAEPGASADSGSAQVNRQLARDEGDG